MQHRLNGLIGRKSDVDFLTNQAILQLNIDGSDITVIGAESGIGKSTVMSGIVCNLNRSKTLSMLVIYHFVGCSNQSNYVDK